MKLSLPIALAFATLFAGAQDRPPANANGAPFACNRMALDAAARQRHFEILGPALRSLHRQVRELPDGFEFEFSADPPAVQKAAEWVAGERLCCPFLDIDLRFPHDDGGFWLRLTGGQGVKQFIRADFDRWFRP